MRRSRSRRLVAVLVVLPMLCAMVGAMPITVAAAVTFTVNRTGDAADLNLANTSCDTSSASGSQCTLRAAIQEANDTPGADKINFNIAGSGNKVIAPSGPLPIITESVVIDGYSQTGTVKNNSKVSTNAVLRIVLDGANAGASANGLEIATVSGVPAVKGLVIQRFKGSGILISGSGAAVQGNFIGTNPAGTVARGNGTGLTITGPDNLIGGNEEIAANLISGNKVDGVAITGADASGNTVGGNYIGTTRNAESALGNGDNGVWVDHAPFTQIGGGSGMRNVMSGNTQAGVLIQDEDGVHNGAVVAGNFVGVSGDGESAVPNLSRGAHVLADHVTVGGTGALQGNVLSGNDGAGLILGGSDCAILGNLIGLDFSGANPLGNLGVGISLGGDRNVVGGTTVAARNVISANGGQGIAAADGVSHVIQGNRIGSRADGTGAFSNGLAGIRFILVDSSVIGGAGSAASNLITASDGPGIQLSSTSNLNVIQGNAIVANDGPGVEARQGAANNSVIGNAILQNGGAGVVVVPNSGAQTVGVRISANQIFGNGGLGIDLDGGTENAAGVTGNDNDDPDTGANNLQNRPVFTSATRSAQSGVTTVVGSLNSNPSTQFRIELFLALVDPSGHGEGQVLFAFQNITTQASGDRGFSFQLSGLGPGQVLTATATSTAAGNTSEFAANVTVTTAP